MDYLIPKRMGIVFDLLPHLFSRIYHYLWMVKVEIKDNPKATQTFVLETTKREDKREANSNEEKTQGANLKWLQKSRRRNRKIYLLYGMEREETGHLILFRKTLRRW